MKREAITQKVLFVTTEPIFIPNAKADPKEYIPAPTGTQNERLARTISDLFRQGIDVYVAQPEYRRFFLKYDKRKKLSKQAKRLPDSHVHLAKDRIFFYTEQFESNHIHAKTKISLIFQREIINRILPLVQPDLIHCLNWTTGLVSAYARKVGIPSLFTMQSIESSKTTLAFIEDIGIDAALFWDSLYFENYPNRYEETRDNNPVDFLLSGLHSASFVTAASPTCFKEIAKSKKGVFKTPLQKILVEKGKRSRSTPLSKHSQSINDYIDIYSQLSGGRHPVSAAKATPRKKQTNSSRAKAGV